MIDVDASEPRDLDDAAGRAQAFLKQYTLHSDYFDDGECRIWMQYTSPNRDKTAIKVLFCTAADPGDPDLIALCDRAINALDDALPLLGYEVQWSLSD